MSHLFGILSLSQVDSSLKGDGLLFDKAIFPFRIEKETLFLDKAEVIGEAIGGTVNGTIGLSGEKKVNLFGNIIPFNALSEVASKIPIIGSIMTGVEGDGIFSAEYQIKGTRDNLEVISNPLTSIAPGVVRDLLKVLGSIFSP